MAPKVDPNQLINPTEVADVLGLGHVGSVSVYRKRYEDFPAPVVDKGKCVLWLRADVERWAKARSR